MAKPDEGTEFELQEVKGKKKLRARLQATDPQGRKPVTVKEVVRRLNTERTDKLQWASGKNHPNEVPVRDGERVYFVVFEEVTG